MKARMKLGPVCVKYTGWGMFKTKGRGWEIWNQPLSREDIKAIASMIADELNVKKLYVSDGIHPKQLAWG